MGQCYITVFSDNFANCSLLYVIIYHSSRYKHRLKLKWIGTKGIWAYLWNTNDFVMIKNRSCWLKESSIGAKTLDIFCGCLGRREECLLSFRVRLGGVVRGHSCLLLVLQLHEISIQGKKYRESMWRIKPVDSSLGFDTDYLGTLGHIPHFSGPMIPLLETRMQPTALLSALVKTRWDRAAEQRGRGLYAKGAINACPRSYRFWNLTWGPKNSFCVFSSWDDGERGGPSLPVDWHLTQKGASKELPGFFPSVLGFEHIHCLM